MRRRTKKKRRKTFGKGKVGKHLKKKNIYSAEMRNQKKEKEEGMTEGKYFVWRRKNGQGNGWKYLNKENIFLEEKEREENILGRKILFAEEKKNREGKGRKISWRRKNLCGMGSRALKALQEVLTNLKTL